MRSEPRPVGFGRAEFGFYSEHPGEHASFKVGQVKAHTQLFLWKMGMKHGLGVCVRERVREGEREISHLDLCLRLTCRPFHPASVLGRPSSLRVSPEFLLSKEFRLPPAKFFPGPR